MPGIFDVLTEEQLLRISESFDNTLSKINSHGNYWSFYSREELTDLIHCKDDIDQAWRIKHSNG